MKFASSQLFLYVLGQIKTTLLFMIFYSNIQAQSVSYLTHDGSVDGGNSWLNGALTTGHCEDRAAPCDGRCEWGRPRATTLPCAPV